MLIQHWTDLQGRYFAYFIIEAQSYVLKILMMYTDPEGDLKFNHPISIRSNVLDDKSQTRFKTANFDQFR